MCSLLIEAGREVASGCGGSSFSWCPSGTLQRVANSLYVAPREKGFTHGTPCAAAPVRRGSAPGARCSSLVCASSIRRRLVVDGVVQLDGSSSSSSRCWRRRSIDLLRESVIEPGDGAGLAGIEAGGATPHGGVGLLQHLLRLAAVAQHAQADAEQLGRRAAVEFGERLLVVPPVCSAACSAPRVRRGS